MILTAGITGFFQQIISDLYASLYIAVGGSLEEETRDWSSKVAELASTGIKIFILLFILWFIYWLSIYALKHNTKRLRINEKAEKGIRALFRYLWFIASIIAIMSQLSIEPSTVKATAKASIWAAIYYVLWGSSAQVVTRVLQHYGLNASIEQLLKNILSVLIVLLGVASVMAQFGFDIVSLVAGLGIVGLAVGFAAQSTLANFIAGITILLEQSFQVGDWVSIGDKEGRVILISLRTTHILTRDNVTVIIPNSTVSSSEVVNLTSKNFIRFSLQAGISYESDIDTAKKVVNEILANTEAILTRPEPSVTVSELADSGVNLIVRFWVTPAQVSRMPKIKDTLNEQIKKAFDKNGISIPYPHMQVIMSNNISNNQSNATNK